MLLGIAADLSAPPSSPTSFRETAMWAKAYRGYDVVAICAHSEQDSYNRWFWTFGIWDYVDDILPPEQVHYLHVHIEGGGRLTQFNLREVLSVI